MVQPLSQNLPTWAEWARRGLALLVAVWVVSVFFVAEPADWVTWIVRTLFVVLLSTWLAGWLVLRRQRNARGA